MTDACTKPKNVLNGVDGDYKYNTKSHDTAIYRNLNSNNSIENNDFVQDCINNGATKVNLNYKNLQNYVKMYDDGISHVSSETCSVLYNTNGDFGVVNPMNTSSKLETNDFHHKLNIIDEHVPSLAYFNQNQNIKFHGNNQSPHVYQTNHYSEFLPFSQASNGIYNADPNFKNEMDAQRFGWESAPIEKSNQPYSHIKRMVDGTGVEYQSCRDYNKQTITTTVDSKARVDVLLEAKLKIDNFKPNTRKINVANSEDGRDDKNKDKWRNPVLAEIIEYLSNSDPIIVSNAARYLQHISFRNIPIKDKAGDAGAIKILVKLTVCDVYHVQKYSTYALKNLLYNDSDNKNKLLFLNANGIEYIKTNLENLSNVNNKQEMDDLIVGIICNLSSCKEVKMEIFLSILEIFINTYYFPGMMDAINMVKDNYTGKRVLHTSLSFHHCLAAIRNLSSEVNEIQNYLRNYENFTKSLLRFIEKSLLKESVNNILVEYVTCTLRNLTFNILKGSKGLTVYIIDKTLKKSKSATLKSKNIDKSYDSSSTNKEFDKSNDTLDLLTSKPILAMLIRLLYHCTLTGILEATAGIIQNLTIWNNSYISPVIRENIRILKGLPILVEFISFTDIKLVVTAILTLRNLAYNNDNKNLIFKYCIRTIIGKIPENLQLKNGNSNQNNHDYANYIELVAAILRLTNQLSKKNSECVKELMIEKTFVTLKNLSNNTEKSFPEINKLCNKILLSMWKIKEFRNEYKENGFVNNRKNDVKGILKNANDNNSLQLTKSNSSQFNPFNDTENYSERPVDVTSTINDSINNFQPNIDRQAYNNYAFTQSPSIKSNTYCTIKDTPKKLKKKQENFNSLNHLNMHELKAKISDRNEENNNAWV
ncbi:Plakophilin-1 [Intoshia linei]|uniref:Plakophilin-1 n=1 Tax=Intoshia linei TaxID=1819745 RepID=A0A177B4A1_9BILA|nr:Plakophilin-1 [Intoshia linei]